MTLTVFTCDDDDDEDDEVDVERTVDGGPLHPARPNRLALCDPDRNGTLSPSESLETPSRLAHYLATPQKSTPPQKSSPSASLRGSWLDLTKQFIMDRKKCLSPKTKVGDCSKCGHRRRRRGMGGTPPQKTREKYFLGNYYVKSGHFPAKIM